MTKLFALLLFFSFYAIINTGSGRHSLWSLATYITGETPFPEFTVVLMLHDIQVGYFDSNIDKLIHSGHEANKMENDLPQEGVYVLKNNYFSMKRRLTCRETTF